MENTHQNQHIKSLSNQKEKQEEQIKSEISFGSFIEHFKNKLKLFTTNHTTTTNNLDNHQRRKPKSKTWNSSNHHHHHHHSHEKRPILIKPNQSITKPNTPITKPVTPITKRVTPITKPSITKPPITKPPISITKPSNPYQTGNSKSNQTKPNQETPTKQKPNPTEPINLTPNSTPNRTPKPSRTPIPTSPSDPDSNERCQGTTREGKPCSRKPMKPPSTPSKSSTTSPSSPMSSTTLTHQALNQLESLLESNQDQDPISLPKFCFQHYKLNLNQLGTFLFNGKWIRFEDWMSDELPNQTKMILRNEMIKPISAQDRAQKGYLYCHEMIPTRSSSTSYPTTLIKVGRSIQPIRRLTQWKTQCPSKQPILRDVFPLLDHRQEAINSYQPGFEKVKPIGLSFHHRWERLCLMELNAWSDLQSSQRNRLSKTGSGSQLENGKCGDCGHVHLELFVFDQGSYDRFIKKLILKWQRWCEEAYE